MGNIMRQPAGVMARGFWLIELLSALHTEQDPRMADESGGTLAFKKKCLKTFHLYWLMCIRDSERPDGRGKGKRLRERQRQTIYLSKLSITTFSDM